MKDYIIITDATTDLSQKIIDELGITVLPFPFSIDEEKFLNYPDNREMDPHNFFDLMRKGNTPKTTQINVEAFCNVFTEYLSQGVDVLCITLSSGISGVHNSASVAAKEVNGKFGENKVVVIDSLCASLGEGMLVYNAAKKKKEGLSIDQLVSWVEENKLKICHWFTVDDLVYLKRGGRVSGVAAAFGTILGIKPVLHVDDDGKLVPVKKVRGRKTSLLAMIEKMEDTGINPEGQTVFISHGDCLEDAKFVADTIKSKFKVKDVIINFIGPVIGAHSGPGTLALFFFGNVR